MHKNLSLILMTLMVLPLLSACGGNPVDDNDANITTQNLPFQNLSEAYTIKNTLLEVIDQDYNSRHQLLTI